ncbi:MAG: histidine kinase [Pseudoxanthomonas suwonensis]|nr:MAG: histidine kinase [Pseudoxanthomonas suwonensis]
MTKPLPTTANAPLDALWRARAILIVLLSGQMLATVLTLAPGVSHASWRYFVLLSSAVLWILCVTMVMLYGTRHLLAGWKPLQIAWLALAMMLFNSVVITAAIWFVVAAGQGSLSWLLAQVSFIILLVGSAGLLVFQNHWYSLQQTARVRHAEFVALQARVRPHFLFNSLNTATALVHEHPDEAERVLLDLSDLFRAALKGAHDLPLEQELELVRRYLDIEALRFGERLRVAWNLPTVLPQVALPALSLQPLVENAIKHGVEPTPAGGDVRIAIRQEDGQVHIAIDNSLPSEAIRTHAGHNIGLPSATARIERLTEGRGHVSAEHADGRFVVSVTLPVSPVQAGTAPR